MASQMILNGVLQWLKATKIVDVGNQDTVSVSSTCLSEVGYNIATHTLTVTFVESGATYDYYGVAEADYEALATTFGSVGELYNDIIKGSYIYARVG